MGRNGVRPLLRILVEAAGLGVLEPCRVIERGEAQDASENLLDPLVFGHGLAQSLAREAADPALIARVERRSRAFGFGKVCRQAFGAGSRVLLIVMRLCFEKPVAIVGWRGLINVPDRKMRGLR